MAFTPTTWVDGSSPAITAAQLNRIETGIENAHAGDLDAEAIAPAQTSFLSGMPASTKIFAGAVPNTGSGLGTVLPSGWSSTKTATGTYTITHNLGTANYAMTVIAFSPTPVVHRFSPSSATSITVVFEDLAGAADDTTFRFVLVTYG